jgi:hypothetical protein
VVARRRSRASIKTRKTKSLFIIEPTTVYIILTCPVFFWWGGPDDSGFNLSGLDRSFVATQLLPVIAVMVVIISAAAAEEELIREKRGDIVVVGFLYSLKKRRSWMERGGVGLGYQLPVASLRALAVRNTSLLPISPPSLAEPVLPLPPILNTERYNTHTGLPSLIRWCDTWNPPHR